MFRQSHRGTLVWLLIVGMALGLTMMAGEVPTEAAAGLLAAYLGLVLLISRNVQITSLVTALPVRGAQSPKSSEVAREAAARARSHPAYDSLIRLLDVGLIVDEQRPDGLSLRRGRFISLDDEGVRPFAIIHVPDGLGGRLGLIRFEIRDESGKLHFVYEDEKWLQPGENPLLPDYRFPIRKKAAEIEAGSWTAHVMVDNGVVGVHNFNVSPSLATRRRQMAADGEILRERVWRSDDNDESLPLSLEELLRQQSRERRQS